MNTPQPSSEAPAPASGIVEVGLGAVTRRSASGEQEVLITQRRPQSVLPGLWEIPGGKCEPRESIQQTVARELHEELGIRVSVGTQLGTWEHTYPHATVSLQAFWCTIRTGTPRPLEVADLAWVRPHELANYPFPEASLALIEQIANTLNHA